MTPRLTICGTRGSIPCSGADFIEFGGNTSCYHIETADRHFILDGGSGLVPLGRRLIAADTPKPISLLLSHFHYDHTQGMPFFAPLYSDKFEIQICGADRPSGLSGKEAFSRIFGEPFSPVTLEMTSAQLSFDNLSDACEKSIDENVSLRCADTHHPGGNLAMRLELGDFTLVYSGDFEQDDAAKDAQMTEFIEGADLALLDSTYDVEGFDKVRGYGHAHWRASGQMAQAAGVTTCLGIHHASGMTDTELNAREMQIKSEFPVMALAREGQVLDLSKNSRT